MGLYFVLKVFFSLDLCFVDITEVLGPPAACLRGVFVGRHILAKAHLSVWGGGRGGRGQLIMLG